MRDGSKYTDFGRVVPGRWDVEGFGGKPNPLLSDDPVVVAVRRRFVDGEPWRDTGIIEHELMQIERSPTGRIDGCRTEEDLVRRYEALESVAESIRRSGYKLNSELEGGCKRPFSSQITVTIGRSGELLLATGGLHRLALLQAMGYPSVPVFVCSRHHRWQVLRDQVFRGTATDRVAHPDLEEFGNLRGAVRR